MLCRLLVVMFVLGSFRACIAEDPHSTYFLWPALSQRRTTTEVGKFLPARDNEDPPAVRITDIDAPFLKRFDPPSGEANGASLVIIPGGGYNYAVVGKEGAEVAGFFNELGITTFVLYYRTPTRKLDQDWLKPVQDAQRAVRLIRANAESWQLDSNRIGLIGFSAGGNAAAIATTRMDVPLLTDSPDDIDNLSARPNFAMLIYPWKLLNADESGLRNEVVVDAQAPPTFLAHAHDDRVTPLSSIEYYKAMKRLGHPCELHIYANGGHGYGLRSADGTNVHTWAQRAADWLKVRGLLEQQRR